VSWLPDAVPGATALDRVFGLRPNLYADVRRLLALFTERALIDAVVLELCRLRTAQLLGCRSELAIRWAPAADAGLSEAKIAVLSRWPTDPAFSEAERACLTVAERFVLDPHGLTDDEAAAARSHLGDAGLVALLEALALFDGFARFRVVLGVEAEAVGPTRVAAPTTGGESMS